MTFYWSYIVPVVLATIGFLLTDYVVGTPAVSLGIKWGLAVALAQSLVSIGTLKWAWQKPFFYWVWGGGMLFRLLVFALTAVVVYKFTTLNFVAVMLTLVVATMIFLLIESGVFISKQKT